MTLPNTKQDLMTEIPQFYFQHGKPVDKITEQACKSQLNALFADKSSVSIDTVRTIVVDVLGLPSYFSVLVMFRCTGSIETKTLARPDFNRVWKELENKEVQRRAYWLLSS